MKLALDCGSECTGIWN